MRRDKVAPTAASSSSPPRLAHEDSTEWRGFPGTLEPDYWGLNLASPFASQVTWDNLLNLPLPQFFHL